MPQGRRKIPFSCKAKRQQLQAKKQRQQEQYSSPKNKDYSYNDEGSVSSIGSVSSVGECSNASSIEYGRDVQKINQQENGRSSRNKYALEFFRETAVELQKRKKQAFKEIEPVNSKLQEISDNYYPLTMDMPKRPKWTYQMAKEQLEMREQQYFREYLNNIQDLDGLSYFELNLETWRQLWRVLEMSDILLIIVDIRYCVLMFPPYLYRYVTEELGKEMILVLNKVDLASPALVVAWKEYFHNHYPKLHILMFTSYPTYNVHGNTKNGNDNGIQQKRRRGKLKMAAEGAQKLLETCRSIVGGKIDLSSWQEKIKEEMNLEYDLDDIDRKDNVIIQKEDTSYYKHEKYKNGVLTIGCIGTPNVGKSSLMNALMGKKVVSVSRTPGHTKHFQTIYLTKNICLCDCPGLVFPSIMPKQLQILMGSYPIAQVREPYTTVKFLAERLDLPKLLRLPHPDNDSTWSAIDICDGWAIKRNYVTARTARWDSYRAANSLLRLSLEGKICLHIYPPNWTEDKEKWESHPDVEVVRWIQARNQAASSNQDDYNTLDLFSEDEEERYNGIQSKENTANDKSTESSSEENSRPTVANKSNVSSNKGNIEPSVANKSNVLLSKGNGVTKFKKSNKTKNEPFITNKFAVLSIE